MNALTGNYHKAFSHAPFVSVGWEMLFRKFSADLPLDLIRQSWGDRLMSSYKGSWEDNYCCPSWEARPVSKDKKVEK